MYVDEKPLARAWSISVDALWSRVAALESSIQGNENLEVHVCVLCGERNNRVSESRGCFRVYKNSNDEAFFLLFERCLGCLHFLGEHRCDFRLEDDWDCALVHLAAETQSLVYQRELSTEADGGLKNSRLMSFLLRVGKWKGGRGESHNTMLSINEMDADCFSDYGDRLSKYVCLSTLDLCIYAAECWGINQASSCFRGRQCDASCVSVLTASKLYSHSAPRFEIVVGV